MPPSEFSVTESTATVLQWIDLVGPLAIAAMVAFVAYQQWRTARAKLRLDLFDRRYDLYNRAVAQLDRLQMDGNLVAVTVGMELRKLSDEAQFLFGREVPALLIELSREAAPLHKAWGALDFHHPDERELSRIVKEAERLEARTTKRLNALVAPYLSLAEK